MDDDEGNASLKFEYVTGKRFKRSRLVYLCEEKQLFRVNKTLVGGTVAYTCRKKGCNARVYITLNGQCYYGKEYKTHIAHAIQDDDFAELVVLSDIKTDLDTPDVFHSNRSNVRDVYESYASE